MENAKPVKTYQVDYLCPSCHSPVEQTGVVLLTYPPMYEHKCGQCHETFDLNKQYPKIRHVADNESPSYSADIQAIRRMLHYFTTKNDELNQVLSDSGEGKRCGSLNHIDVTDIYRYITMLSSQ